jgi:hypothetical protein
LINSERDTVGANHQQNEPFEGPPFCYADCELSERVVLTQAEQGTLCPLDGVVNRVSGLPLRRSFPCTLLLTACGNGGLKFASDY